MKAFIEWVLAIKWGLRCAPHFAVVARRHAVGRWYFFRDRPLWFVVTMADMQIEAGDDEQMTQIIAEAQSELARRLDQILRNVEGAVPLESVQAEIAAVREQLKKLGK